MMKNLLKNLQKQQLKMERSKIRIFRRLTYLVDLKGQDPTVNEIILEKMLNN